MDCTIVTASIGNYDRIQGYGFSAPDAMRFIAIVDGDRVDEVPSPWVGVSWEDIVPNPESLGCTSPRHIARLIKTLAYRRAVGSPELCIWLDGKCAFRDKDALVELVSWASRCRPVLAAWDHPVRASWRHEIAAAESHGGGATSEQLRHQEAAYLRMGYRDVPGLWETSLLVRTLGSDQLDALDERWWSHIRKYSLRDQVSLPIAAIEVGARVTSLPWQFSKQQTLTDRVARCAHRLPGVPRLARALGISRRTSQQHVNQLVRVNHNHRA